MMRAVVTTIALICLMAFYCGAQTSPRQDTDLSRLADDLLPTQEDDLNYEERYENIMQLLSNPVDLNKATADELRFFSILSEQQIGNFLDYRKTNGNLLSVYELQAIPEFDLPTIHKMMPFTTVIDPSTQLNASFIKRIVLEENNYFVARYERTLETKKENTSEATSSQKFKGSPDKLYFRFRTSRPGDFSIGFTAEKDAGEEFVWNRETRQYGLDYLSAHLQLQNKGNVKNLIIGDFQTQFAQGLMLGGSFGLGKGAETISSVRKSNLGLQPYTSSNEAGFMRGVASTYTLAKNISVTGFFSRTRRDGTLYQTAEGETIASAFQTTGFHRNESELKGRKSIMEQNYGVVVGFKNKTMDAGVLFNAIDFNTPIVKDITPYNQFAFSGKQHKNIGVYLNYSFQNFTFFSEVCKTLEHGNGALAGVLGSLSDKLDVSLIYRNYQRDFHTFYANALSENTLPQNEAGIYWGAKYKLTKRVTAAGYLDLFRFPWLRFRSYTPSNGNEWLGRITYQPSKHIALYVQARAERKVRNTGNDGALFVTAAGVKRNYWINCDYQVSPRFKMKTRAQFSSYSLNSTTTTGMALIQDLTVDIGRLDITARYALFDTDDFDNRQYAYERDVLLAYSLPAYNGVGVRSFILASFKVSKKISVWTRFARTAYTEKEIVSGAEYRSGNTRNDIKFQLRLQL